MHEEDDEDEYEEPTTGKVPQNNEGHMSQQEVAEVLGMSRSRVSELEKKALRKFKYYLLKKYKEEDL
jgi:DNA-directed RNA polymerase sigma subunit (sigma70/sigma32)